MKDKKTRYINSVLRHIKSGNKTKERIKFDLETEFENKLEQGMTIDEIIREKGEAKNVAAEFNNSYRDSEVKKNYLLQKVFIICGCIFAVLAAYVFLRTVFGIFLLSESNYGIIGGADGPTTIIISSSSDLSIFSYIIVGSILLLLGIAFISAYIIWKKKK